VRGHSPRAVIDHALRAAPDVDVASPSKAVMVVIGGWRDRVVPAPWVRGTARRYAVRADFVESGHLLMMGQASNAVARVITASS